MCGSPRVRPDERAQPSKAELESVACPYERSRSRVESGHAECPFAARLGRFSSDLADRRDRRTRPMDAMPGLGLRRAADDALVPQFLAQGFDVGRTDM
jgi:hypothetical protein